MSKGTILITGGAGFIGSVVNKLLWENGYKTVILDNLSTGCKSTIKNGIFIEGETGNQALVSALLEKYSIDAVMHFAAKIDIGESFARPADYYENNLAQTLIFLKEVAKYGIKVCVFSSTAAVYGRPEQQKIRENHPLNPVTPYGRTKLMVELALKDFEYAYGLRSCSLRYFNAAGGDPEIPTSGLHETNLIPLIFKNLIHERKPFTIFGQDYDTRDGTCLRDYIHVQDLATAHLLAMEQLLNGGPSNCYNLGNGDGFTILEIIQTIEKVTGHKIHAEMGSRRHGDVDCLIADATKAHKELGWSPHSPDLSAIIKDAWQAYSPGGNSENLVKSNLVKEL